MHLFERHDMKHYRQHYKTDSSDRAEAALGLLLALFIGIGIAYVLVQWWSA